jgi:hypothetical protein
MERIWRGFEEVEVDDTTIVRSVTTAAKPKSTISTHSIHPKNILRTAPNAARATQISQPTNEMEAVRRLLNMGSPLRIALLTSKSVATVASEDYET